MMRNKVRNLLVIDTSRKELKLNIHHNISACLASCNVQHIYKNIITFDCNKLARNDVNHLSEKVNNLSCTFIYIPLSINILTHFQLNLIMHGAKCMRLIDIFCLAMILRYLLCVDYIIAGKWYLNSHKEENVFKTFKSERKRGKKNEKYIFI
jgi:hypothetical protein